MFTQKNKVVITILTIVVVFMALVGNVGSEGATLADNPAVPVDDIGTAITYQGSLTDNGNPANGAYDFLFTLFDAPVGGTDGPSVTLSDVAVSEGLFTVELDFLEGFDGQALWLEIEVRPGSSTGNYTTLSPRQALTAAPYALGLRPGATIAGEVPSLQGVLNLSSNEIGLNVSFAGSFGVRVEASGGSGIRVESAGGHGVSVGSAGVNGVFVSSAVSNGVFVTSTGGDGVEVVLADGDGFKITCTGSATCSSTDSDNFNGLEVGQAEDYGARVLGAGRAGFRIDDPGTNGFYAADAGDSGIWVAAATNYAGFFNGNINVTGNCTGCRIAAFGLNDGSTPLRPGDIVTIAGIEQSQAANTEMLLAVHPAAAGQALIGVVAGRAEWHTSAEDGTTVLVPRDGETAEPGDFLTIITHGPVQVRAGDTGGAIVPGTRLTLDSDGRTRPLQMVEVNGVQLAESSPVIGLALSTPDSDGLVWVLVNPQ